MTDEFDGLSWDERDLLRGVLRRYRNMRRLSRKDPREEWSTLRPLLRDGHHYALDIVVPDAEDEGEEIDYEPALPPSGDDTRERMEKTEAWPKEATEGTDELPALRHPGDCAEAIRKMFEETGEWMTGGKIKQWLQDHGYTFGDSTVEHALSDMVHKTHELVNFRKKGGYGLSSWV